MNLLQRPIPKRRMRPLGVVEAKVPAQPFPHSHAVRMVAQVDVLVFHRSSRSFDEGVVRRSPSTVHADRHPGLFQNPQVTRPGETAPRAGFEIIGAPYRSKARLNASTQNAQSRLFDSSQTSP